MQRALDLKFMEKGNSPGLYGIPDYKNDIKTAGFYRQKEFIPGKAAPCW